MISMVSGGVQVTVETYYQPEYSNPISNEFMFAYRITIENRNEFAVKLISRHWNIFDSNGDFREVQGEGVVGVQPLISPGEAYQYISGCNLKTEMGRMHGEYLMENILTHRTFNVSIPAFEMQAPLKLN